MLCFDKVNKEDFLNNYWQKKPLVIRQALPDFVNLITPDELAGLSMDDEIESRLVISTPNESPFWHLKNGPFLENDFKSLPEDNWTLLVQGVDRFVPELARLFDNFNFIPQWRIDDLMISYAVENGSVGPHYDNYDVFLYQARGSRKWSLTTKNCNEENYISDVPLRIMEKFEVDEEYILNEGDMLYLPSKVGHYGKALAGECMTYSFGYRSYVNQELWDDFGDYCSENMSTTSLYQDPNWNSLANTSHLPQKSWLEAKKLMLAMLDDEDNLKKWFGCFVTRPDQHAHSIFPEPINEPLSVFLEEIAQSDRLVRNTCCRFAYLEHQETPGIKLFINGREWDASGVSNDLIKYVANNLILSLEKINHWLNIPANQNFLFDLWTLQWLEVEDNEYID